MSDQVGARVQMFRQPVETMTYRANSAAGADIWARLTNHIGVFRNVVARGPSEAAIATQRQLQRFLESTIRAHRHLSTIPPDQPVRETFRELFIQVPRLSQALTRQDFDLAMRNIDRWHPWARNISVHVLDTEAHTIFELVRRAVTFGP